MAGASPDSAKPQKTAPAASSNASEEPKKFDLPELISKLIADARPRFSDFELHHRFREIQAILPPLKKFQLEGGEGFLPSVLALLRFKIAKQQFNDLSEETSLLMSYLFSPKFIKVLDEYHWAYSLSRIMGVSPIPLLSILWNVFRRLSPDLFTDPRIRFCCPRFSLTPRVIQKAPEADQRATSACRPMPF